MRKPRTVNEALEPLIKVKEGLKNVIATRKEEARSEKERAADLRRDAVVADTNAVSHEAEAERATRILEKLTELLK